MEDYGECEKCGTKLKRGSFDYEYGSISSVEYVYYCPKCD